MKTYLTISLLLCWLTPLVSADQKPAMLKVLRYAPVNDTIVDAISPGGLVKTKSGDLIVTFTNKGDSAAGSKSFFVRSKDQGKSWSDPYMIVESKEGNEGLFAELAQLPNGDLMMIVVRIRHRDSSRKGVFGYRESEIELKTSKDNGETFQSVGVLDTAPGSLVSTAGLIYQLKNGDLIFPAYCYTSQKIKKEGYQYGAGFFRRKAGQNKWGRMEAIFKDPPSKNVGRQGFNETAFAVREDGSIIAYARVDSHKGADYKKNKMWRCQSNDHGKTWSKPVETKIAGTWPMITQMPSGEFVMICGLRDSKVRRRTTSFFTSIDGINWEYRGHPYYSRSKGVPANSATGGAQSMLSMGGKSVYIVFYAHDPKLPGYHKTYVDGCLVDLP